MRWIFFHCSLEAGHTPSLLTEGGTVTYLLFHLVFFTINIKTGSSKKVAQTMPTMITSWFPSRMPRWVSSVRGVGETDPWERERALGGSQYSKKEQGAPLPYGKQQQQQPGQEAEREARLHPISGHWDTIPIRLRTSLLLSPNVWVKVGRRNGCLDLC